MPFDEVNLFFKPDFVYRLPNPLILLPVLEVVISVYLIAKHLLVSVFGAVQLSHSGVHSCSSLLASGGHIRYN